MTKLLVKENTVDSSALTMTATKMGLPERLKLRLPGPTGYWMKASEFEVEILRDYFIIPIMRGRLI